MSLHNNLLQYSPGASFGNAEGMEEEGDNLNVALQYFQRKNTLVNNCAAECVDLTLEVCSTQCL